MKKFLAIALALVMILALAACGGSDTPASSPDVSPPAGNDGGGGDTSPGGGSDNTPDNTPDNPPPAQADGFELALITDLGSIDDRSFNQGSWEGLEQYALENNITHKYYQPADQGDDSYLNAIDLAVQSGAKVIVTPGFLFETPIFVAQDRYPDVKFILIDGTPHAGDYNPVVAANTVGVLYAEEQAGFLAGYAAVKDGYTQLGFMGGIAVPAVVRFGHGYVQGAEAAAQDMGLADGSILLNYFYTDAFWPMPEIQTRAAAWYNDGIEVIFSCGGAISDSIIPAASQYGQKVIGVDVDQSGLSDTIITSAMKELAKSVYDCITDFYSNSFPGGQVLIFSAANGGVGLPMATSRFNTFSQADYEAIFARLLSGAVVVDDDISITPDAIPARAVNVNYQG